MVPVASYPHYLVLLLVVLCAPPYTHAQPIDGSWIESATPTVILQGSKSRALCLCSSDPILKDPTCTLCYCPESGNLEQNATIPIIPQNPSNRTCGASGTKGSVLRLYNTTEEAAYGPYLECRCGPDPWLSADNAAWTMCKCPRITFCMIANAFAPDRPCPNVIGGGGDENIVIKVPDSSVYTHFKSTNQTSPPGGSWPWCGGEYALCSLANCTMEFKNKDTSDLGPQLAECGCITANEADGLGKSNFVDPTYIMSMPLYQATNDQCLINSTSTGCPGLNQSPVCKGIVSNTIYDGQYDLTSTYTLSPRVGGFQLTCPGPGIYAQCMTAACYKRRAFDGSPVTCYCPVYQTNSSYVVGGPWSDQPIPCTQPYPYVLSGVDTTGGSV